MQQQIEFLRGILESIDNDQSKSMSFYTGAYHSTSISQRPNVDCKWRLINDILHQAEHVFRQSSDCLYVDKYVTENFKKLNDVYQHNQHLCWRLHEHHFHVTFESYINCPMTCLCEIGEYLQKLQKEIYHS